MKDALEIYGPHRRDISSSGQLSELAHPALGFLLLMLAQTTPLLAIQETKANNDVPIRVQDSSGNVFAATLSSISTETLRVVRESEVVELKYENLGRIDFLSPEVANQEDVEQVTRPESQNSIQILLRDGSRIGATELNTDEEQLVAKVGKEKIGFLTPQVRWVRFSGLTEEQEASWQKNLSDELSSDRLILKQQNGTLTKIDGIVVGIKSESVLFEFSGQQIPIPFSRLAGIQLFAATQPKKLTALSVLTDRPGNQYFVAEFGEALDSTLSFRLVCGTEVVLRTRAVASIDFGVSSSKSLADISPIRHQAKSLFNFPVDELSQDVVFGVRRLKGIDIPGSTTGPGIEFLGSGEATFEIPEGFSKLIGSVKLNPRGNKFTGCTIEIYSESTLLWSKKLDQADVVFAFEVPVKSDERLRLVVSANSAIPTGDVVHWLEPRLIR